MWKGPLQGTWCCQDLEGAPTTQNISPDICGTGVAEAPSIVWKVGGQDRMSSVAGFTLSPAHPVTLGKSLPLTEPPSPYAGPSGFSGSSQLGWAEALGEVQGPGGTPQFHEGTGTDQDFARGIGQHG
jgi:hypothetical protein